MSELVKNSDISKQIISVGCNDIFLASDIYPCPLKKILPVFPNLDTSIDYQKRSISVAFEIESLETWEAEKDNLIKSFQKVKNSVCSFCMIQKKLNAK